LFDLLDCTS